jgi:hypothetical protein
MHELSIAMRIVAMAPEESEQRHGHVTAVHLKLAHLSTGNKDWNYWKEAILHDLERVHPDIRKFVSRIDIMRLGTRHGAPQGRSNAITVERHNNRGGPA